MPVVVRAFALVLLTLGLSAADAQTSEMVGTWEFVDEGSTGIEMLAYAPVLTLRADGTLQMLFSALPADEAPPYEGTYTVEGERITAVVDGEPATARFWFDEGDLYIDDDGDVMRFRRTNGD